MTSEETVIDLIRHGEPVGGSRFRGNSIDDPLSEKGWQQMWDAVDGDSPWQHIITSPMRRCHAFSHALSEKKNIPFETASGLKEVGFGAWEGLTREEVKQQREEEYNAFYQDPVNNRPGGSERFDEFVERVAEVYKQLVHLYRGEHVLVVTHAGVIRALLIHALNEEPVAMYKTKIDNASITRIRHGENHITAEFINSVL